MIISTLRQLAGMILPKKPAGPEVVPVPVTWHWMNYKGTTFITEGNRNIFTLQSVDNQYTDGNLADQICHKVSTHAQMLAALQAQLKSHDDWIANKKVLDYNEPKYVTLAREAVAAATKRPVSKCPKPINPHAHCGCCH